MRLQHGVRTMSAVREARWPSAGAGALKVQNFIFAHSATTEAYLAAIQAMAAPHPLERKRSKGYAPRIVAGGIDCSSSEEEAQPTVRNAKGA